MRHITETEEMLLKTDWGISILDKVKKLNKESPVGSLSDEGFHVEQDGHDLFTEEENEQMLQDEADEAAENE